MTENVESLILEHLRHIRAKVDRLAEDVADLKLRAGLTDEHIALLHADNAMLASRLDRLDARLVRIERRLDLAEDA